jgi:hypothetical protein
VIVPLSNGIALNAFTGEKDEVAGPLAPKAERWGSYGDMLAKQEPLEPDPEADLSDWTNPEVGWGVVLPDRDDYSPQDKAAAADAPRPVRELLAERPGAPVLRYRPDLGTDKLTRHFPDGTAQSPKVGLTPFGTGKGHLPLYLLIVGTPAEVPWDLQYSLNRRHHVGRLALSEEGLANYVRALIDGWTTAPTDPGRPLIWSVSTDSMTKKMDVTISAQLEAAFGGDAELKGRTVIRGGATHAALLDALRTTTPSVVMTSSHGRTGPLDDQGAMRAQLGLPVDAERRALDIEALLAAWSPGGAVWYAQACCSAGSNAGTSYDGLLAKDTLPQLVVSAVAGLGAQVAPLPSRLLGAPSPLRAFVGHVEPTFDWTLLAQDTGQFLTGPLVAAMYPKLYRRRPVGRALEDHYRGVAELYSKLEEARKEINKMIPGARERATYSKLTALDRESLVILGDPTAVIPPLPSQR